MACPPRNRSAEEICTDQALAIPDLVFQTAKISTQVESQGQKRSPAAHAGRRDSLCGGYPCLPLPPVILAQLVGRQIDGATVRPAETERPACKGAACLQLADLHSVWPLDPIHRKSDHQYNKQSPAPAPAIDDLS